MSPKEIKVDAKTKARVKKSIEKMRWKKLVTKHSHKKIMEKEGKIIPR